MAILQLQGRTSRDLRTLAPVTTVVPSVSPTDVTTPGHEFERDSGGRLAAATRMRWDGRFQQVTDTLVRESQAKESSVKKRHLGELRWRWFRHALPRGGVRVRRWTKIA
jgi:hypothetical protein